MTRVRPTEPTLTDLPPDTAAEVELADDGPAHDPADEISRLISENAALKEQMLRVAADAENTKRRAEKEANDTRAYAIQRFARDLFDAADTLGRAVAHAPQGLEDQAMRNFVAGVQMTEKQLQTAFERNGLKQLNPERGARFDPHYHQAMMEQPDADIGPSAIAAVMQPGYELFGRMVRPAMVAVTPKAPAASAAPTDGYARAEGAEAGAEFDTRA